MAIAALWILGSHCYYLGLWNDLSWFKPLLAYGWAGVDVFLFLSGIGIGFSLSKRPSAANFFSKRFNRIFPTFFIAIAIEHLIYNTDVVSFWLDVSTISYWLPLIGIHSKSTFWYVSAIFVFYFIAYFYYKYCFVKNPLLFTIVISILGISISQLAPSIHLFTTRIPIFFIGMYFSLYLKKEIKTISFILLSVLCYITLVFCAWKYGGAVLSEKYLPFYAFIFITPGFVFLLSNVFSMLDKTRYGVIVDKGVDWIGKLSLELYLIHWILLCAINAFDYHMPWGIFVLLSLFLSYILHRLVNILIRGQRILQRY